ncbi:oligosaccharide flippase family protein [Mediterraneibacter massiliensis]|uniref:oligosaccharide flippase family protein n=1 Tax=Mediterraneibacter massiliensis TaxID=1720300 RepID=UPI0024AE7E9F|nr:oligosaccharide flippase family protein [Mediterraneibacter massiliensis]
MYYTIKEKIGSLIKGGFFHIFIGNTLVKMIAFVSSIVIVRLVSKDDYAYLTYADNLYNYVISFAGLGMASSILKYCATAKTKELDKAYFVFAMKYGTLFEAILSLLVVIYVTVATIPFPEAKSMVYVLVFYPILNNVLNTVLCYLRAHGENTAYARAAVIQTTVVFLGSVCFVLLLGIPGIAYARYCAIGIAIFVVAKSLKKYLLNVSPARLAKEEIKSFMVMSISLTMSNLFSLIMPINEMTLVNELLRSEAITSNYKIAIMIPGQLSFVTQSIIVYYFTIVARTEDKKEVWKISKKIGMITALLITVISIAGIILTPYIIRIVYGSRYEDAIALSSVFWVVNALNAAIRMIPMNFLPAIGIAKFNAVMAAVSCVCHIILTYAAIIKFGIWGAGIATGLVYIGSGIVYWIYFRKKCLESPVT